MMWFSETQDKETFKTAIREGRYVDAMHFFHAQFTEQARSQDVNKTADALFAGIERKGNIIQKGDAHDYELKLKKFLTRISDAPNVLHYACRHGLQDWVAILWEIDATRASTSAEAQKGDSIKKLQKSLESLEAREEFLSQLSTKWDAALDNCHAVCKDDVVSMRERLQNAQNANLAKQVSMLTSLQDHYDMQAIWSRRKIAAASIGLAITGAAFAFAFALAPVLGCIIAAAGLSIYAFKAIAAMKEADAALEGVEYKLEVVQQYQGCAQALGQGQSADDVSNVTALSQQKKPPVQPNTTTPPSTKPGASKASDVQGNAMGPDGAARDNTSPGGLT